MRFQLPQQSTLSEQVGIFCNDSVYGKCNVLSVSGIVKMDATMDGTHEAFVDLSVWPSEEQGFDVFDSVNGIKRYVPDWESRDGSGSYVNPEDDTVHKILQVQRCRGCKQSGEFPHSCGKEKSGNDVSSSVK